MSELRNTAIECRGDLAAGSGCGHCVICVHHLMSAGYVAEFIDGRIRAVKYEPSRREPVWCRYADNFPDAWRAAAEHYRAGRARRATFFADEFTFTTNEAVAGFALHSAALAERALLKAAGYVVTQDHDDGAWYLSHPKRLSGGALFMGESEERCWQAAADDHARQGLLATVAPAATRLRYCIADMIEGGRLTEDMIPDDFDALCEYAGIHRDPEPEPLKESPVEILVARAGALAGFIFEVNNRVAYTSPVPSNDRLRLYRWAKEVLAAVESVEKAPDAAVAMIEDAVEVLRLQNSDPATPRYGSLIALYGRLDAFLKAEARRSKGIVA
jgi:hypothetical protein